MLVYPYPQRKVNDRAVCGNARRNKMVGRDEKGLLNMVNLRKRLPTVFAGTIVILLVAGRNGYAELNVNDYLDRHLFGKSEAVYNPCYGNGWIRWERFTNTHTAYSLELTGVDAIFLSPEELGFEDLYGPDDPYLTNFYDAYEAAESQYPHMGLWGTSFWTYVDAPRVNWSGSLDPDEDFPITLGPGEYLDCRVRAYSDIYTNSGVWNDDIGELVIGYQFGGKVLVPEPSSLLLFGSTMFLGAIWLGKRRAYRNRQSRS